MPWPQMDEFKRLGKALGKAQKILTEPLCKGLKALQYTQTFSWGGQTWHERTIYAVPQLDCICWSHTHVAIEAFGLKSLRLDSSHARGRD